MRNQKGITIIALIITIIVLLILAGVSIALVVGDNGIATKSQQAKERTTVAQEREMVNLAYNSAVIDGADPESALGIIQTELDNLAGVGKTEVTMDENGNFNVLYLETRHNYSINGSSVTMAEMQELHITNYSELVAFANMVNSGNPMRNYFVYLDNNVTIEDDEWVMIGYYGGRDDPSMEFGGVFNGNGHTISGLKLPQNSSYKGLFFGNSGTIKNLNVEATYTATGGGQTYAGAICSGNSGKILDCNVNITATANSGSDNRDPAIGGIAATNGGIVNNCTVTGSINASGQFMKAGGIVGRQYGSGTISNCRSEVSISSYGSSQATGGITGENGGEIYRCINTGELSSRGGDNGGITGTQTYENGVVNECVNKGNLIGDDPNSSLALGGICGRNYRSSVTNCYNAGNISVNTSNYSSGGWAAGIVANEQDDIKIENCYNIGQVTTGIQVSGYAAFGSTNSIATNSYYNNETCSQSDSVATGLTSSEMKASSFVSQLGSSFAVDANNINNGYPVLSWQNQ